MAAGTPRVFSAHWIGLLDLASGVLPYRSHSTLIAAWHAHSNCLRHGIMSRRGAALSGRSAVASTAAREVAGAERNTRAWGSAKAAAPADLDVDSALLLTQAWRSLIKSW